MSTCTPAEIEEKKRQALERLIANSDPGRSPAARPAHSALLSRHLNKPTLSFYNRNNVPQSSNANRNGAENFLKTLQSNKETANRLKLNRNLAHPYNPKPSSNQTTETPKQLAPVFTKIVTCTCSLMSDKRFTVKPTEFHSALVDTFKTIPSKSYEKSSNQWSFAISDYNLVQERVGNLKPNVTIGAIPKNILKLFLTESVNVDESCIASIEPTLAGKLLSFQKEGVCFGISKHGRVLIADEMGLGKTYQALAIADFYREDWPLLICTSASTRDSWINHIRSLLPHVPCHNVSALNSKTDYIGDAKVVVSSYAMMERNADKLLERHFGVLIMDESQTLKNQKAKCTNVADRLSRVARRVILLSGTPALSRPLELFSQLQMLDRSFIGYMDYTKRYCDAKQTNFGWDCTGQSNLEELNVVLKKKFMIRRLKAEVLPQLADKSRETIILDTSLVSQYDENGEPITNLADSYAKSKGRDREEILFKFFHSTAAAKIKAVCAYLKTVLATEEKFVVFAYHQNMIDAICSFLDDHKIDHIRIDGSTKNDVRSLFIKKFQTKRQCKAAVLAIKACNAGITLTAAQLIIFAELDWNPSTLAQAESRCHRIGQEGIVKCRYLLAPKTADDIIWSLVRDKQQVLNKAGIFSENIQDGEPILGPSTNRKIDIFLQKKPTSESNKDDGNRKINLENSKNCDNKNEVAEEETSFQNLLDDDDDVDFANLDF